MSTIRQPSPLLHPPEAAQVLAISKRTLWELTREGVIPSIRIKRAVRYSQSDLEAYIQQQRKICPNASDDGQNWETADKPLSSCLNLESEADESR